MAAPKNTTYDDAYFFYLSGLSLSQVASLIGVTRQCVYKAFVARGFVLRKQKTRVFQIYDGKKFTLRNNGYFSLSHGSRMLMHRYVYEKEIGKIPDGWDIHHINQDKTDNRIENLECLPKSEHTRLYSPHNNQYTKKNQNARSQPL